MQEKEEVSGICEVFLLQKMSKQGLLHYELQTPEKSRFFWVVHIEIMLQVWELKT